MLRPRTFARSFAAAPEIFGRSHSSSDQKVADAILAAAEVVAEAILEEIAVLSPTTRLLTLRLLDLEASKFTFIPGMWVDFYIPAIDDVGGYTIISLPEELPKLQLAVKVTRHPPAAWIGAEAKAGDKVALRAGGHFHLSDILPKMEATTPSPAAVTAPAPTSGVERLVFVAGGIGLTPLYAMARHWAAAHRRMAAGDWAEGTAIPKKLTFLYSARTWNEMVLLKELRELKAEAAPSGIFDLRLHVTGDTPTKDAVKSRVGLDHLVAAVDGPYDASLEEREQTRRAVLCCMCGPLAMTDGLSLLLKALGLKPEQVRVERWW